MDKVRIIQSVIDKLSAKSYLEIGVQRGKNFFPIKVNHKAAVDPHFMIGLSRRLSYPATFFTGKFFEMTSDTFFEKHAPGEYKEKKIEVAFIDGLHTYEQSFQDFKNCARYLSDNGVILFHDCNPVTPEAAAKLGSPLEKMERYPGQNAEWNGDVWKSILHIRSLMPEWQAFVLDCDYGIGVATRRKNTAPLHFTEEQINALDYADLERNRRDYLGLNAPGYLNDFLATL